MKDKKAILLIVLISASFSIFLGMIDYETESFWHLLTSDAGNIITLILFTLVFTAIGLGVLRLYRMFSSEK